MFKKQHCFAVALMLLIALASNAQAQAPQYALDRGVIQIQAQSDLTFAISTIGGASTTNFRLVPSLGYFIIPNLVIGGTISLDVRSRSVSNQSTTSTTFGIGPYGAYYFANKSTLLYPLVGAQLFFTTSDGSNAFDFEFFGGINYMISKNVGLIGVAFLSAGPREGATALTFGLRGGISAFVW